MSSVGGPGGCWDLKNVSGESFEVVLKIPKKVLHLGTTGVPYRVIFYQGESKKAKKWPKNGSKNYENRKYCDREAQK